ncbi:MAG: zinc-binding dehydrogenase, partial [Actinomycetota bacterium]|nr:zinc-binding dehydrogenase [Actinomycetota bacterium]
MRAVTIRAGDLVVADRDDPVPGTGQVLVAVRAAGLNNADLMQLRGQYPAPPGSPQDIPGLELAGEVTALGDGATRFRIGDRVMAVVGGGGQAELAVVHERMAMPVPPGLSWEEAGAVPETWTTAHDALFTQCGLALGERVCVSAGAGGVGTAAVRLAVAAGARVTATVRNAEMRAGVARLGASAVDPEVMVDEGPFDVILELIGAPNLGDDLAAMATGGRIVVIGLGGGSQATVDLSTLMARRGRIYSSTLRARPMEEKARAARAMESQVLPLLGVS